MIKNKAQSDGSKSIIKQLIFQAVLYLPLCFFIWFYASSLLVIPVKYLLQISLYLWQPDLFNLVTQFKYLLTVETLIFPKDNFTGQGDNLAVLDVVVNPMIYGYGIALISALALSLPKLNARKRMIQILLGYLIVVCVQTIGCFWELLKHLIYNAGPDAQSAILNTGLSANLIALMYQLSYLILPSVVPIAYWIIMNNNFIGEITGLKSMSSRNFETHELSDKQE
jgi:hypothetical protein